VGRIFWDGSRWLVALVDRTAYPRLPRSVAARELAEVFTPTTDEVAWARAKTTTDQHCLSLLVLLKCYREWGISRGWSSSRRRLLNMCGIALRCYPPSWSVTTRRVG
jgi:uncharacterized protein DUF4158